ncbi:hypothetical protein OIU74_005088, partial [Salix koriyanagi]
MGACFSTIKVSGSNSNNTNHNRKEPTKPQTRTATTNKQEVLHSHHQINKNVNNEAEKKLRANGDRVAVKRIEKNK